MADFYVKHNSGVTARANSTAYVLGDRIVPARTDTAGNAGVAKAWVWECVTAGTSGAAVPTWPASVTQDTTTVTDGTVTWRARRPGFSSGGTVNWTFATIYFDYAANGVGTANSDRIFVSSTHSESVASSIDALGNGLFTAYNQVLSVNDSAAPPTTLAAGAAVTVTSGNMLLRSRGAYYYGMVLQSTGTLGLGSDAPEGYTEYDTCELRLASGANLTPSLNSIARPLRLTNCTINFAASNCEMRAGAYAIRGGGVKAGSSSLSSFFTQATAYRVEIDGFDFSALSSTFNFFNNNADTLAVIKNCKLPAGWSGTLNAGSTRGNARYEMHNCDSGDTNYRLRVQVYGGSIFSETTVVRTGGASDGTTPLSWRMVGNTDCAYFVSEVASPEIVRWNDTTGSAITVTVETLTDNVTLTDAECWLEVTYLGTNGFPLALQVSDRRAGILTTPANQTSSSVAWTTTGITTPVKQKLSVTFTPQEKGYISAVVKLARASTTVYVDPLLTVT